MEEHPYKKQLELDRIRLQRAAMHASTREAAREILSRVESVDLAMHFISKLNHVLEE